jgi:hypothetical protein
MKIDKSLQGKPVYAKFQPKKEMQLQEKKLYHQDLKTILQLLKLKVLLNVREFVRKILRNVGHFNSQKLMERTQKLNLNVCYIQNGIRIFKEMEQKELIATLKRRLQMRSNGL